MAKDFRDKYAKLKTSNVINALQVICDTLMHYQHDLNDINKLDVKFIENMAGVEFRPFQFTTLDYKDLFLDEDIEDNAKKYLLIILHKIFKLSYDVYQLVTSPDIDVDEFVDIILQNLDKLKKHAPGLSRCNKAFNKIRKSAQLLKTNFNTYFKDLQETKSPTIMMENFILDVAKDTDADPETMRQFKLIIKYYRESTAKQRGKDPKMDMLFKKVDEHLASYDTITKENEKNHDNEKTHDNEKSNNEEVETTEEAVTNDLDSKELETNVTETKELETKEVESNSKSTSKKKDKKEIKSELKLRMEKTKKEIDEISNYINK